MNGLPYYKACPRDFIEGTVSLSFELKAAYRLVLDLVYMQGGQLPDDSRYISGLLGLSVRKWNDIRKQLIEAGKLTASNECLSNYRAIKELETSRSFQDKQAENRSHPNKNNGLESPRSHHTDTDTDTDTDTEDKKSKLETVINVVPADAGMPPRDDRFAFSAETIRLTAKDLAEWRRSYPHLSLEAELWALDSWAGEQKSVGKNWFHAISNALAKKERAMMSRVHMARVDREAGPLQRAPDRRL